MIGRTISHYKILKKLGEGGMGEVYLAGDIKLKRQVAIKFLHAQFTKDQQNVKRFEREAEAAATLNHPNIVTIHDIIDTDDPASEGRQLCIVMEHVDGRSLRQKIVRKEIGLNDAIDIIKQICEGLAKAHQAGIVHRDIKPENILIDTDGRVKILDFGLAKLKGVSKLTAEKLTMGTTHCMSPEQLQGKEVDHRTDIWSLGVIIYEMLTGQLPFKGEYESAVIYSILNNTQEPVTGLRSGVPIELERIINKCLQKNPAERYQHADDLIVDLNGLKYGSGGIPTEKIQKKRFKPVLLTIFIMSAIILIVTGYFLIRPDKRSASGWGNSIAVLPFDNISNDPEQEYFCDGITEDIIANLSKIGNLKVISRTSVMQYKDVNKTLPEIADELNVNMILEGTVRQADDRVRIVAQLIEATEDKHIWAETYDREVEDIFAIQSEVAEKIAGVLQIELSENEKTLIQKKQTEDFAAYNFYIKGREFYYLYRKEDNEQAIRMFKKALEIDPDYALAYAGLGDAYSQRYHRFGFSSVWIDSAIKVSKEAINIDPNSAEAYKALGTAYSVIDRTSLAIVEYKKAIELNPGYFTALGNLAYRYKKIGRLDEAIKWNKREIQINPVFDGCYAQIGLTYTALCEDSKAQQSFEKALELYPKDVDARWGLVNLYLAQIKYSEALARAFEVLEFSNDSLNAFTYVGYIEHIQKNLAAASSHFHNALRRTQEKFFQNYHIVSMLHIAAIQWKRGEEENARQIFAEFLVYADNEIASGNESWEIRYNIAGTFAVLGEHEKAFQWLDRAIDAGWREYRIGMIEPLFENLRQDNRFERRIQHIKGLVDKLRDQINSAQ